VGAVALVGLPPTAGFMGKFFLLTAAWNRGCNWLVVIGAGNVAVALFYYLNLVRYAYAKEIPEGLRKSPGTSGMGSGLSLAGGLFLAGLVLLLGIFPNVLFGIIMP
jgi:NADH:ubiquinone oxidoreductase subunit 2 (subunit N)